MKRVAWLYSGMAGVGLFFCAASFCVGGEGVQMRILQLARLGRNAEAIESFESLPERDEADIAVLRAAAGCYWRERRFDEARVLYWRILERQSSMNARGDGDQHSGLLGRELPVAEVALEPETVVNKVVTPSVAPEARTVRSPDPGVQEKEPHEPVTQEPETLKARYRALDAERESQRQEADARMAALTASAAERAVDLELVQEIDRGDQASLELALEEIERLEQEQAASDAAARRQQASLLQRIEMLKKQAVETDTALAAVGRELEKERRLRFELEARAGEQAKVLDETGAMLEEAKAALGRQHDAIREQVQAGTTMRLEDGETKGDSTARVLAMARETEAALTARIRELETAFALPDTEFAFVVTREGTSLRDTVFDSILAMIPADEAAAITRFEALPLTPGIPGPVLKAMGNLYREQGNYASARALFEQLLERDPDDIYAERKLVMTLFDMGLYDLALDRLAGPGKGGAPDQE